jgi:hypothetical protein
MALPLILSSEMRGYFLLWAEQAETNLAEHERKADRGTSLAGKRIPKREITLFAAARLARGPFPGKSLQIRLVIPRL